MESDHLLCFVHTLYKYRCPIRLLRKIRPYFSGLEAIIMSIQLLAFNHYANNYLVAYLEILSGKKGFFKFLN